MKEKAFTSITDIEKRYNKWITINIAMFVILVLAIGAVVYAGAKSGLLTGLVVSHSWAEIQPPYTLECTGDQFMKGFTTGAAAPICATPGGGGGGNNFPSGLTWGTRGQLHTDHGSSIELGSTGTPYIDFHNDGSSDYDVRLILTDDDELKVVGGNLALDSPIINNRLRMPGGRLVQSFYLQSANRYYVPVTDVLCFASNIPFYEETEDCKCERVCPPGKCLGGIDDNAGSNNPWNSVDSDFCSNKWLKTENDDDLCVCSI